MMDPETEAKVKAIVERSNVIAVKLWLEFGRLASEADDPLPVFAEFERRLAQLRSVGIVR